VSTYSKLPIEEIEARFAQCRAEPSMRSVTAILRITREQMGARGSLSHYPRAAIACSIAAAGLWTVLAFLPPAVRQKLMPISIGVVLVTGTLTYGAVSGASDRRAAVEQERKLQQLAADSLEAILGSPFPRKPMEREHLDTLRDLVKAFPDRYSLRELLGVH
jgi:hypothetical protein